MQITTLTILILLFLTLVIQLYYLFRYHSALIGYKIKDVLQDIVHPVSVVISARNEEKNLRENLLSVLDQDYPDFEVIVVNDCSWDDSEEVLKEFSERHKNLKVVTINEHERFKHGKKFALTLGIKAASKDILLFTDADCVPASENWIRRMQQHFTGNIEIALGYSPYTKEKGLLNKLIRFETFFTAVNYLSFALKGRPYMGVGRNLAYKRDLFFTAKGFASHMHILSGDDDLFVNQNATAENTAIEIHPDAQVWSVPQNTFSSYFRQKMRHFSAGKVYKKTHQFSLSLQVISASVFYATIAASILLKAPWYYILTGYAVRLLFQLIIYAPVLRKLSYKDLFLFFVPFDLIYYFYVLAVSIITLFKKKVQWR